MTKFAVTPNNPRVSLRELAVALVFVVGLTSVATLVGVNPAVGLLGAILLVCLYVLWRQRRSPMRTRDRLT